MASKWCMVNVWVRRWCLFEDGSEGDLAESGRVGFGGGWVRRGCGWGGGAVSWQHQTV